jgi:hypothetical protein
VQHPKNQGGKQLKSQKAELIRTYRILVENHDQTGFWKLFLDQTEASQEFWKSFNDAKCQAIRISKEYNTYWELPENLRAQFDKKEMMPQ